MARNEPQSLRILGKLRSQAGAQPRQPSWSLLPFDLSLQKMNTHNHEMTPTERLAAKIADLEAKLALADERTFYLTAQLAQANARLGVTDFKTMP